MSLDAPLPLVSLFDEAMRRRKPVEVLMEWGGEGGGAHRIPTSRWSGEERGGG